ncbi:MAG: NAD(P)/FAD-dependent oxidoreductase [Janthinobacterium lividum]
MRDALPHPSVPTPADGRLRIAVLGSGISGMAAAWLLSRSHDVTVFEKEGRVGGHSHTVTVDLPDRQVAVDTGFIVYNEPCYPNLTALFKHLGVATQGTDMSLAVSLDNGALEYAGDTLGTLFAQRRNLYQPRFWAMLRDLVRFYREAPRHLDRFAGVSIGNWLAARGYSAAFRDDHLLPMAAAIWSAPAAQLLDYPAEAFVRFCENHGLLRFTGRPQWRSVMGGSVAYVEKLTAAYKDQIRLARGAASVQRRHDGVWIRDTHGATERFDAVVIATHADEALALLSDPSMAETAWLGAFRYSRNRVLLHSDVTLMPRRREVWSSWNYLGHRSNATASGSAQAAVCVSYWMNRLQHLGDAPPMFVTLNPSRQPAPELVHFETEYSHPVFDLATLGAQRVLWNLQGKQRTWFCGAYFGAGFHEDGLQAGLAVAEQLGGVQRPWRLEQPSARIHVRPLPLVPMPASVRIA